MMNGYIPPALPGSFGATTLPVYFGGAPPTWYGGITLGARFEVPAFPQSAPGIAVPGSVVSVPSLSMPTVSWNCSSQNKNRSERDDSAKAKVSSSKFRGVSWHARDRAWSARIWINGKAKHIGTFETELRAALAFDIKAFLHYGADYKNFNFPEREERMQIIKALVKKEVRAYSLVFEKIALKELVKVLAKPVSHNAKRSASYQTTSSVSKKLKHKQDEEETDVEDG